MVDSESSNRIHSKAIIVLIALSERIVLVSVAARYIFVLSPAIASHPSFFLAMTSEFLAVLFVLFQKSGEVSTRVGTIAVAYAGTLFGLLVRPGGSSIIAGEVAGIVMALGLLLSVGSKIALNRSFGLVAANRGVKRNGPYRIIRHPMYLGYVVTQVGFLSQNLSALNIGVYLIAWTFQLLRIRAEEEILRKDASYRAYQEIVRWKLIPGLV